MSKAEFITANETALTAYNASPKEATDKGVYLTAKTSALKEFTGIEDMPNEGDWPCDIE